METLAARIHDALPQTQCTRCGYPDCAGYAQAIASGEAGINQCPPGGAEGIARLAMLTGQTPRPLDSQFGAESERALAVIDEAWCIGCTRCLDACPTDAIVGIHKRMHTVIEPHCTGCELCIAACPVDCIAMETATPGRTGWQAWSSAQASHARERYELRRARQGRIEAQAGMPDAALSVSTADAHAHKRATIEAALAKARTRRHASKH